MQAFPQTYTSLQMYVAERDIEVTVGKVRGNWGFQGACRWWHAGTQ
jgi:hypothetical protein